MLNYSDIKLHCRKTSQISADVVDQFLIYYAAQREKLEREMDGKLLRYHGAGERISESARGYLKAEYIAFKIFKTGGYVSKYLNHVAIKNLPVEQYELLTLYAQTPWRLSFSFILNNPAPDFFEVEDIFSGEVYLLHSPSIQKTPDFENRTWLMLLGYNGKCWQAYGLNIGFKSFLADDIYFFATEINPAIEGPEMLMKEVERNPFPFFFLLSYSEMPTIVSRGHELRMYVSTDEQNTFESSSWKSSFTLKQKNNVLQLKLKRMGEFPHYAVAYYDEKEKQLIRTSMTEKGFDKLTQALTQTGMDLPTEATISVAAGMVTAAKEILGREIVLNPYQNLFNENSSIAKDEELDKLNRFLDLAIPAFNKNEQVDIRELSRKAGLDESVAEKVWEKVSKNISRQLKKL